MRRSIRRLLLAVLAATFIPALPAAAYNLLPGPQRWPDDEAVAEDVSRLEWYVDGVAPPSMNLADVQPAMDRSWKAWEAVSCNTLETTYMGVSGARGFNQNGFSVVTFEDPFNSLGTGIYAANVRWDTGPVQLYNGISFRRITETDTVFNDGWNYQTHQQILDGCAGNEYNIESTATHEFGHGLGYGHSCEQGESCTDPDEQVAIMFWSGGSCETVVTPQVDDSAMHNLVYGANFTSSFSQNESAGSLPFNVNFVIDSFADATGLSAVWAFGDGGTSTELAPSHTYTDQGEYTVSVEISGNSASCANGSNFTHDLTATDAVLACGDPDPTFTFAVNGKTVDFTGDANGQGIGCVTRLNWDFGDGSPAVHVRTPQHTFSEDGTYEVSLAAEGVGGISAPVIHSVEIKTETGCGSCTLQPGGTDNTTIALGLLLALCGVAVALSRRNV